MTRFFGYLFAKLSHIGSKSEGPQYFLQQWEEGAGPIKEWDTPVEKTAPPWKQDPALHPFVSQKVVIEGDLIQDKPGKPGFIRYKTIESWWGKPVVFLAQGGEGLHLTLQLSEDPVWVNKMPPVNSSATKKVGLSLLVSWLGDAPWQGQCPTSQLFDFAVLSKGKEVWRWGEEMVFAQVITTVTFHPGEERRYQGTWTFPCKDIKEGTYTAKATFLASGQSVSKDFEIKVAC